MPERSIQRAQVAPTAIIGGLLEIENERIVGASVGWLAMTGWRGHELVGRHIFDLIHPDDVEPSKARTVAFFNDGQPSHGFINRWRKPDGSYVHLSWSPVVIEGRVYAHALEVPDFMAPVTRVGQDDVISLPDDDEVKGTGMDDSARIAELTARVAELEEELRRRGTLAQGAQALLADYFRDPDT